jgi:APA family basic amino acid/polyamine antiporter
MKSPTQVRPELSRDLGASHATAIVVGTVIGSGIFLVPAEMMHAVGSAKLVYLAWIVGGLLSLFGALTYAELGAVRPESGGEYAYLRDAYGPLWGFLYAWTFFLLAKPASIATVTAGVVRILSSFPALSILQRPVITFITYGHLLAIIITIFISWLNYIGIRRAGEFQRVFTILKVGMVLLIVAAAFSYANGSWANFSTTFSGAKGGVAGFMAALVAALWAYDGWNDLTQVGGEVRNPQRSIPIGLIAGMMIVAALYISVNAAVQYAMPAAAIADSAYPASQAVALALGSAGAALVSAAMALSMIVTMNGTVMSGARVPFAMARDGYFFRAMAEVHPRFHTPSTAIIIQATMAIALTLFAGTFQQLFSLAIYAEWLFYMLAASTVFVFRKRERDRPRPYSTWGYPLVPLFFIVASAVLLYYTFTENLRNSAVGTLIILAGVPVFYWFRSRSAASRDRSGS